MRIKLLISLLALAHAATADDALIDEGAELYADFCATCHGDDVDGLQTYSGDLEDFTRRIEGETEDMPDFTDTFDPEEIEAMHAFVMNAIGLAGEVVQEK